MTEPRIDPLNLPTDTVRNIASYSDLADLEAMQKVNKTWHATFHDHIMWENIAKHHSIPIPKGEEQQAQKHVSLFYRRFNKFIRDNYGMCMLPFSQKLPPKQEEVFAEHRQLRELLKNERGVLELMIRKAVEAKKALFLNELLDDWINIINSERENNEDILDPISEALLSSTVPFRVPLPRSAIDALIKKGLPKMEHAAGIAAGQNDHETLRYLFKNGFPPLPESIELILDTKQYASLLCIKYVVKAGVEITAEDIAYARKQGRGDIVAFLENPDVSDIEF